MVTVLAQATVQTPEEQVREAMATFNARDLTRWSDLYAEDALHFQPGRAEPLRGRSAIRDDYLRSTWRPFPDFHFELEKAFAAADRVCVMGTLTGTHEGPLSGVGGEIVPPTHKPFRVSICLVARIADGKFVEVHEFVDRLGFLEQLGLVAAPV